MHRVEEPCNICRVWPCRKGYEYCCGNYCRNPGLSAHVLYHPLHLAPSTVGNFMKIGFLSLFMFIYFIYDIFYAYYEVE